MVNESNLKASDLSANTNSFLPTSDHQTAWGTVIALFKSRYGVSMPDSIEREEATKWVINGSNAYQSFINYWDQSNSIQDAINRVKAGNGFEELFGNTGITSIEGLSKKPLKADTGLPPSGTVPPEIKMDVVNTPDSKAKSVKNNSFLYVVIAVTTILLIGGAILIVNNK